jgi:hypothetical protein
MDFGLSINIRNSLSIAASSISTWNPVSLGTKPNLYVYRTVPELLDNTQNAVTYECDIFLFQVLVMQVGLLFLTS